MDNSNLAQRCYNFGNMLQNIPSVGVGAITGMLYSTDSMVKRSKNFYNYIEKNSLPCDKFTKKTAEKELIKNKIIRTKGKELATSFLISFIGVSLIFEYMKHSLFKFGNK